MKIFIITLGRPDNQKTYKQLSFLDDVYFVCDDHEASIHRELYGPNVLSDKFDGLGHKRQWIVDQFPNEKIVMFDDDLDLCVRKSDESYHLRRSEDEDVVKMLAKMESLLDVYPIVGLSSRQGNNNLFPKKIVYATRQTAVHAINTGTFKEHGLSYIDEDFPLMEDFNVLLSLLTQGIPNAVIADYAWNHGASNAKGGCSAFRTPELQERCSNNLKAAFPDFVNVVTKKKKTGWEGMKERVDVIIQWKKAFEYGKSKKGASNSVLDLDPQDPPNSIQIEFTEGCNLQCSFCGVQGMREKAGDYKFMDEDTLTRIAIEIREAGWNSRIELAMHGEPTMNKKMVDFVRILRENLPKHSLMMTSNGGGLLGKPYLIDDLFEAGLNCLALDDYDTVNIVPKLIEKWENKNDYQVTEYPNDLNISPHHRRKPNEHIVIVIGDITQNSKGTHAKLATHCGAGGEPPLEPFEKRCAKPFRELSFRYDGSVCICCEDFRGEYFVDNIHNNDIVSLWNSERFQAARIMLYNKSRDFHPCRLCTNTSLRVGILPDRMGKKDLPKITDEVKEIVNEKSIPLSKIVLREWEK